MRRLRERLPSIDDGDSAKRRSSSLSRISMMRRNSLPAWTGQKNLPPHERQDSNNSNNTGVRRLAQYLLAGLDSSSPTRRSAALLSNGATSRSYENKASILEPPRRKRTTTRRTPVLTLALMKLDEHLLSYGKLIADPTYRNAASACELLDSTIATASAESTPNSSPKLVRGSPSSPKMSPTRSPIRSWLAGSGASTSEQPSSPVSSSALALEQEWQVYVRPLFLLAAAEALYASLDLVVPHLSLTPARNLIQVYARTADDLRNVKATLCDPFLPQAQGASEQPSPSSAQSYYGLAGSVGNALAVMISVAQTRIVLIQLQVTLWGDSTKTVKKKPSVTSVASTSLNFSEMAEAYAALKAQYVASISSQLPLKPPAQPSHANSTMATQEECPVAGHPAPLHRSLMLELNAWSHLMQLAHSLERCRFVDSILNAKKLKSQLQLRSNTCLQVWFRHVLQQMMSMFPVFFQKVEAFAKPLYGFTPDHIEANMKKRNRIGAADKIELRIEDFLRKQEKGGGPIVAVAVVVDAARTSNLHMERGFVLADTPSAKVDNPAGAESVLVRWPAVYMRSSTASPNKRPSTTHSNNASGSSILDGIRRSSSKQNRPRRTSRSHEDGGLSTSSNMLKAWSTDGPTSLSPSSSNRSLHRELDVLEYAPDSGDVATASWPHCTWNDLIVFLTGSDAETAVPVVASSNFEVVKNADRRRPTHTSDSSFGSIDLDLKALPMWPGSSDSEGASSPFGRSKKTTRSEVQTNFHVSALSSCAWLVVMVKGEEDSRWHRRRSRAAIHAEIQELFEAVVPLLQVNARFDAHHVNKVKQDLKRSPGDGATPATRSASITFSGREVAKTEPIRENELLQEFQMERSWDDGDVEELLIAIKDSFGLKSLQRPRLERRNSYAIKFPSLGVGQTRKGKAGSSMDTSVAALFLGPELMHAFDEF